MNRYTSETIIKLNKLSADWRDVTAKIITQKTFDYELFKEVFVKTFKEAERLSHQKNIEKRYISLLLSAKDFEATRHIKISEEHRSACHLTRSMLHDCFSIFYSKNESPVMIDSKNTEYSYEDVETLMHLIKNHL